MAFGIDDVLMAAAAAISLGDTLVKVVRSNSYKPGEMHALLSEVRTEAIKRIDEAHVALNQFEATLRDKGINLKLSLSEVISQTPFWRPFESYRLSRAKKSLDYMGNTLFRSSEDVTALVRCMNDISETRSAVVESSYDKHNFQQQFMGAPSVGEKISLARQKLDELRDALAN